MHAFAAASTAPNAFSSSSALATGGAHGRRRMRLAQRAASAVKSLHRSTSRWISSSSQMAGPTPTTMKSSPRSIAAAAASSSPAAAAETAAAAEKNPSEGLKKLKDLRFRSTFASSLPADPDTSNVVRQVSGAAFSFVNPTPTSSAGEEKVVAVSRDVAEALLGLDADEAETSPEFAALFSGNLPAEKMPEGMRPYAMAYAGHQFGSFAGQLGDGRAICLGDVEAARASPTSTSTTSSSSASTASTSTTTSSSTAVRPPSPPFPPYPLPNPADFYELQLKGAGTTPYSRFADGRAVLRSSVREFVASEAMAALAVPTTRALSLALTGAQVVRDQFYDGRARLEPGAVVCRVSPCFVRFGSFELPAARGEPELARALLDFVVEKHYPHLKEKEDSSSSSKSPGLPLLLEVAERTGKLVAAWQACGFVHGVLNTDNCSILGETIDYGPYGWIEAFDVDFTPNTTDLPGRRYSFRNQPSAVAWNVERLAAAFVMTGLVESAETASEAVEAYAKALSSTYEGIVASKFGLPEYNKELAVAWLSLMSRAKADWTNSWRSLSSVEPVDAVCRVPGDGGGEKSDADADAASEVEKLLDAPPPLELARALARLDPVPFAEQATRSSPAASTWEESGIPEEVLEDAKVFLRMYRLALGKAAAAAAAKAAAGKRYLWPERPLQDASNPAYVPRNHLMHTATQAIEGSGGKEGEAGGNGTGGNGGGGGDGGAELRSLLEALRDPFVVREGFERYRVPAPLAPRAGVEILSCSS